MTKLSATLKKEFLELLPPTIFFFVALHIVMFVRVLMLEEIRDCAILFHFDFRRRPLFSARLC